MHTLQAQFQTRIKEMVEACHACAARQYTTSHGGNLSWRVAPNVVLITPTKVTKGKVQFDDVVLVDMERRILFAKEGRRPTGEVYIHLGIYRKRPDIASIIHAHPAWLTALALSKPELLAKPLLPEPIVEIGPVAVTEYAQPLTEELAATFDPFIERYNAFIMKNHGAVTLSVEGIGRCLEMMDILEMTAKSAAIAEMLGGAKNLSKKEVEGLAEVMQTRKLAMPGMPGKVQRLTDLYD